MSLRFKDTAVLKEGNKVSEIEERVKTAMGAQNVKYLAEDNRLAIDARKIMFAIKDNARALWMFIGYEPQQMEMMKMLIPTEVLTNFKL